MKRTLYGTECDAFKDQRKVAVAWSWGGRKEFLGQGKNFILTVTHPVLNKGNLVQIECFLTLLYF